MLTNYTIQNITKLAFEIVKLALIQRFNFVIRQKYPLVFVYGKKLTSNFVFVGVL